MYSARIFAAAVAEMTAMKDHQRRQDFYADKSRGYFSYEYQNLRDHPEEFFGEVQIYPDLFDVLLELVKPHLHIESSKAMGAEERLFITLV